jgi:hypothetical protein
MLQFITIWIIWILQIIAVIEIISLSSFNYIPINQTSVDCLSQRRSYRDLVRKINERDMNVEKWGNTKLKISTLKLVVERTK